MKHIRSVKSIKNQSVKNAKHELSHPKVHEHCVPHPPMKCMKGVKHIKGVKCAKPVNNGTGDKSISTADA